MGERRRPHLGVSLRDYLESRIDALDRSVTQGFETVERASSLADQAAKEALVEAKTTTEKRFDGVNEFRQALNDVIGRMMPRVESESHWRENSEKLSVLNDAVARLTPRVEAESHWHTNGEKLSALDGRLTRIEGAGLGVKGAWAVLLAVIASMAAIVGVILGVVK